MLLREHGERDAEKPRGVGQERARGEDHTLRGEMSASTWAVDPHSGDVAAGDVHGAEAAGDQLGAGPARQLEEMHPELLAREPAAPARVEERHCVFRNVREVPADQGPVQEEVDAGGLRAPVRPRGWQVGRRGRPPVVDSQGTGPPVGHGLGHRPELGGASRSRRAEHVASPVHPEDVVARVGELLQEVDAPVHEPDHRVVGAGPEVPVGFGGLVAREGERRALVDEHHAPHAVAHGQMVGGRRPGDAGAADDDVGGRRLGQAGRAATRGGAGPRARRRRRACRSRSRWS